MNTQRLGFKIKVWIWEKFNFPYVMPPGRWKPLDDIVTNRTIYFTGHSCIDIGEEDEHLAIDIIEMEDRH